jgi:hypothetical protein
MTKGTPKKRQRDDRLREKRVQAASALVHGAAAPLRTIPSVIGCETAVSGPL